MNFGRIEARYHDVDLLDIPLRRALNLTYEFLRECYQLDGDGWEKDVAPIFVAEEQGDSDVLDIRMLGKSGISGL